MNLQRAANIAMIVTCLAVTGSLAHSYYRTLLRPARPSQAPYRVGERIADTSDLGFEQKHLTLLLITASTCHFCSDSMSFYRKLVTFAGRNGVRLVGVSAEDSETNRTYLMSNGVSVDNVASLQKNGITMFGTPTLILVRSDGVVVECWPGKLSAKGEKEVLDAIGKATSLSSLQLVPR